jgi:hypothetical protein
MPVDKEVLTEKCYRCGKEMFVGDFPTGVTDTVYCCEECAKNMNGYVSFLPGELDSRIGKAGNYGTEV